MTTPNAARETVYRMFAEGWGATTPYCFDADPFSPPADGSAFVRLAVRNRINRQHTLGPEGGRRWDRRAAAIVQIFTPPGGDQATADALGETVRGIFEGKRDSGLVFEATTVQELPPDGDHNMALCETPFSYEETR